MTTTTHHRPTVSGRFSTRSLLTCGVLAGPIYLAVGAIQAAVRDGFDPRRHALSLLANGSWGWIQSVNLMVCGLLVIAAAAGLHRTVASRWAPRLLAVFGFGTLGGGIFRADPALGFPVGTPENATSVSWHGVLHFTLGGIGFLCLILACAVLARRLWREGVRGWAVFTGVTGLVFFAGFAGIASGSAGESTTLGFYFAVCLAFAWLAAFCARSR